MDAKVGQANDKSSTNRFNTIDLAILENGQYNDNWADIHTLPSQLPQTIKTLNPKQVVTVHNSKFVLANHAWDEPLEKIAESAKNNHINLKRGQHRIRTI